MDLDPTKCNDSYIPTSAEYFIGLGSFSSSILIIGGLITVGLFILFFEQVVYTNQTAHRAARRHIYWITSVFPMMTLMSLVALLIPRAHNVCTSVKMVYMSIGISHFTDLTMVIFGGEELVVERACDDTFDLQVNPLCCCCRCLPRPPVTKYSLRLVVLLTDQLPFAQSFYHVTVLILLSADNITLGDVEPSDAFLWLNLFKLASALFGVYGFMILSSFSSGYLDDFEYRKKARSISLLLLITNAQSLTLSIMANYGAFPCLPPYVPPTVYKQTVENSIYLLEMMILGPYSFWHYHDQRFSTPLTATHLYRSRSRSVSSHSIKDDCSSIGSAHTTITDVAKHSDDSDDKHNNSSRDSTRENSAVIEIVTEREDDIVVTQINSRNSSTRGSRSCSGKSSSTGDSASDSSRKGRKNIVGTSRKSSRENSDRNRRNDSREESSTDSDRTSKHKSKRSTPSTSQITARENSASRSKNSTRERSVSPSNTNTSAISANHTRNTSTQAPSILERVRSLPPHITRGKTEYVRFQEE